MIIPKPIIEYYTRKNKEEKKLKNYLDSNNINSKINEIQDIEVVEEVK